MATMVTESVMWMFRHARLAHPSTSIVWPSPVSYILGALFNSALWVILDWWWSFVAWVLVIIPTDWIFIFIFIVKGNLGFLCPIVGVVVLLPPLILSPSKIWHFFFRPFTCRLKGGYIKTKNWNSEIYYWLMFNFLTRLCHIVTLKSVLLSKTWGLN